MKFPKHLILLIVFCWTTSANAQYTKVAPKTQRSFQEALELKNFGKYEDALKILKKLQQKDPEYIQSYLLAADIYQLQGDTASLVEVLQTASNPELPHATASLQKLLNFYYLNGKYAKALQILNNYPDQQLWQSDKAIIALKERLEFSASSVNHPTSTTIFEPDSNLNTPYNDYWPSMGVEGNQMVTSILLCDTLSNGSTFCQEDIYFSTKDSGIWKPVQPIGSQLNTDQNEGGHCLSANGEYLFFTACNRNDGQGSCDIYYCHKRNGRWSLPIPCETTINTQYWDGHPSIDGNGSTLYFSSERPGGQGGKDLWQAKVVYRSDGSLGFTDVKNLGPTINTEGDEISPFIHFDAQTLYFSSNGHVGLGRHDIFKSTKMEQSWSKPQNLGYPINTWNDEIGFIVNARGDMGWMASERNKPDKDIYALSIPSEIKPQTVVYYKGIVKDKNTMQPLKAQTTWFNFTQNEAFLSLYSDAQTGEFLVCLKNNANYSVHVTKPGYLFYSQFIGLNHERSIQKPFTVQILLEPIKPGNIMVLDNVFFATDSYEIQPESYPELEQLLLLLSENPQIKVEIRGHTDNVGTEVYNKELSKNRAGAVYNYLIKKGIKSWRLSFEGYGSSQPVADNDSAEGRAKNRRTEAMIVK